MDLLDWIAEQDNSYNIWKRSYEECAAPFEAYANAQPEDIRNFLWGYAESGRRMYQRKRNLTCEYMEFKK